MDRDKVILIVDDDKAYVERLGALLEKAGYEVLRAYDGEQALEVIKETRPDLIILDMIMPKMGGLAFYDRITPAHSKPLFPILVVTARKNLQELFDNLPVDGFIAKPVEDAKIVERVNDILSRKAMHGILTRSGHAKDVHRSVLIIDHDFDQIQKVALIFLDRGYTVTIVKGFNEAVERVIDPDQLDLILIRYGMPGYPEFTITYHLRGIHAARKVSIVVYTTEYKKLDVMTEREILDFVGEKNLLDMNPADPEFFVSRCERIVEERKKLRGGAS